MADAMGAVNRNATNAPKPATRPTSTPLRTPARMSALISAPDKQVFSLCHLDMGVTSAERLRLCEILRNEVSAAQKQPSDTRSDTL